MTNFLQVAGQFVPLLVTLVVVFVSLGVTDRFLRKRWKEQPDAQFRFQMIMLALTLAGVLAIVLALPIDAALRGQLLGLIGILLSAAIALSSTTFIGNIMAGVMLKVVRNARPGDFVTVADLTGRITEMDLLHTEIQTELRDLVTVPNLYMVTQPLKVVRASGTIITAEVSLGYDVPHTEVEDMLRKASESAGLKDGFVHILELGDFAITYRVAGLLEDIKSLISARSQLRVAMLDALHQANIEIVSPNFMNTRALQEGAKFIPAGTKAQPVEAKATVEDIAFDKADEAASLEKIRLAITEIETAMGELKKAGGGDVKEQMQALEEKKSRLLGQLAAADDKIKNDESG